MEKILQRISGVYDSACIYKNDDVLHVVCILHFQTIYCKILWDGNVANNRLHERFKGVLFPTFFCIYITYTWFCVCLILFFCISTTYIFICVCLASFFCISTTYTFIWGCLALFFCIYTTYTCIWVCLTLSSCSIMMSFFLSAEMARANCCCRARVLFCRDNSCCSQCWEQGG